MCVLGCSVKASVNKNKIVQLEGNPESTLNRGKLCAKGNAGIYKAIHPERLGYPLRRVGKRGEGKWERISWSDAMNEISETLLNIKTDFGAESIAFWQNVNMYRKDIFERFMYALGSPNFIGHQSACDSSRHVGAGMAVGPVAYSEDFENSECIFILGSNPCGVKSSVHATQRIVNALKKGAKLIVADPRLSETAALADKGFWLPIKPGTDGILLAGIINYIIKNELYDREYVEKYTFGFDKIKKHFGDFSSEKVSRITGISEKQFLQTVKSLIGKKSLISVNRGVVTHADGLYAMHAAVILSALLGRIDREGGNAILEWPPIKLSEIEPTVNQPNIERIDEATVGAIPLPFLKRPENPLGFFGLSQNVSRNILRQKPYPLKALIFNAVNPVYSLPQGNELVRSFEKVPFIVSIDAFMAETTSYADIVLPSSVYLENYELWFNENISLRQPVIKAFAETKSPQNIIIELAKKMGLKEYFNFRDYKEFIKLQLKDSGISFDELEQKGCVEFEVKHGALLEKGLGTPSKRIELYSSILAGANFSPMPVFQEFKDVGEYPFKLITYKLPHHTQSATASNPYLLAIAKENYLKMNTSTAQELGFKKGDTVTLETKRGKLQVILDTTEGIRPDTLALSHHFGHKAYSKICAGKGVNANSILSTGTDIAGGNITFNDNNAKVYF